MAVCHDLNLLSGTAENSPDLGEGVQVVWSGWRLGDETGLATWGLGAWQGLATWCDRASRSIGGRGEIWFRPYARHVLSDTPRCAAFLRAREPQAFGLLLDPVGMLAASMLDDATDHLERMFETLAPLQGTRALLLTNVERDERGEPRACPIDRGLAPLEALARLVSTYWPSDRPIVVMGHDPRAQAAALSAAMA